VTLDAVAVDRVVAPPAAKRRALSGALLLPAATALSGVLTYGFLVLAARTLGPAAYGRIGVLWGAMFIVAIVVFRPLEQMIARAMSDRLARGLEVRSVVRTAVVLAAAALAVIAIVAAVGWPLLERRLFRGDGLLTALLVVGVALYGGEYLVRGVLGGTRWFAGYGIGLIADAATRLLIALPLVVVTRAGAAFGETAMRVLYGGDFLAPARSLTLLCASVGLYLVAGTISQALLATDRASAAACAWVLGAAVFVGGYAIVPGEPLFRVALALVAGTGAVAGALGALALRSGRPSTLAGKQPG
jgi:O-antigen/teichoic acid export membrane protein